VGAIVLATLLLTNDALALRVMTYNILNYSSGRLDEFRTVLAETQPDVLVVEEILSQTAVNVFASQVLEVVNPGEWAAGDFVNGYDTDNAIFYRPATTTYVGHHIIGTTLRDIDEWTVRPATHTSPAADIRIYVVHLKASQGSTNEQRRLDEVTAMRERMETFPPGQAYVVAGDFNIYTASEPAYQYMIGAAGGPAGIVQDPIDREGNWHVNFSFADIHTQSTRTTSFGGGATGGMDDRFDMMLVGPALQDGEGLDILADTYTAFGQDGLHFDTAINQPPYVVVDSLVAEALHDGSDHLPVYADFQLPALLVVDAALDLGTVITGGTATSTLVVENGAPVPADELDYSLAAPAGFSAPGGAFVLAAGAPPAMHSIDMATDVVGAFAGDLIVSSDDPDRPAEPVALSGTVLDHAQPSLEAGTIVLADALDLGTVASGDSASAEALVHNVEFGALRALLEVYDYSFDGDPRFFLADGVIPALIGSEPGVWTVAFDALGAPEGDYAATLTFENRDQPDLSGAIDLAALVLELSVSVTGGSAAVALDPAAPVHTGFVQVAPNPFRPVTYLDVGVGTAGRVELRVYDAQGRSVRTLVTEILPAGIHRLAWDGRDAGGRPLPPGIYFARLETDAGAETRKLVRLR
jgi:exonuclease III